MRYTLSLGFISVPPAEMAAVMDEQIYHRKTNRDQIALVHDFCAFRD